MMMPLLSPAISNGVFTNLAAEEFVPTAPMRDALAAYQDRYAHEAGYVRDCGGEWVTERAGQLAC